MRLPIIRAATAALLLLATALGSSVAVAQDEAPPSVEVTGDDYAFVGLPSSVPVGTSFRFVNGGDEDHEIFIARRNEGTTETLDELLALPQEELGAKVTLVGGLFANVGQSSLASLTLDEEGDYIALCFVSQGTANGVPPADPQNAPPHAMLGMRAEFTVGAPDTPIGPLSTPLADES